MNFGFNEEQDQLRLTVRRFLDEKSPIAEVRRVMQSESGYSETLWKEMAELGWVGLTIPEAHGGAGLGWTELIVLLEEAGKGLLPSPLLSHTLATAAILDNGDEQQRSRWLPSLADGSRKATVALFEAGDRYGPDGIALRAEPDGDGYRLSGQKRYVPDPGSADLFVVAFRTGEGPDDLALGVVATDAAGVSARAHPLIDETKRLGNLDLDGVHVPADALLGAAGSPRVRIERMIDQGAVATTAEAAGAVEQAIAITVQYAKQRIQFDQPIGHFQGVKHPLAEMYVDLESFKSLLYYATWCLEHRDAEASRYASLAKAYATDTFVRVGLDSIQLHGAIGFTVDYDIQLYFKRSKWFRPIYGEADTHYERSLALRGV